MQSEHRHLENRRLNKKPLWWLGGGILALFVAAFGFLYLQGFFRQEPEYKITNVPTLQDNRFSLLVVSLSNALTTSGRLTGFWVGADAIYAARLIEKIDNFFVDAWRNSRCLTHSEWENRPITEKIQGQLGLIFKPLL